MVVASFREKAGRRFAILDNSCGSIVSTAAWVALHANHAAEIMHTAGELMCNANVPIHLKEAVLCVLHECVASCASGAVPHVGRHAILESIRQTLPASLQAAAAAVDPQDDAVHSFRATINKIMQVWRSIEMFPSAWYDTCLQSWTPHSSETAAPAGGGDAGNLMSPTAPGDGGDVHHIIPNPINHVLRTYQACREKVIQKRARDESTQEAEVELAAQSKSVVAALKSIMDAVSSLRDVSFAVGSGDIHAGAEAPVGPVVSLPPEDDVLGSFF